MIIRYILSFIFSFAVSGIGSIFSRQGLSWYYSKIKRPRWTPSGRIIGTVWTTLFTLAAIAGGLIWTSHPVNAHVFVLLFAFNGIINIAWSYVFFFRHRLHSAIVIAAILCISVISIIVPAAKISHAAAWLLVPYALWTAFATFLSYSIAKLNPGR